MVAGDAARAHAGAGRALAHAARARQRGAEAPLLLHAQEEVSHTPHILIRALAHTVLLTAYCVPHDNTHVCKTFIIMVVVGFYLFILVAIASKAIYH